MHSRLFEHQPIHYFQCLDWMFFWISLTSDLTMLAIPFVVVWTFGWAVK